MTREKEAAVEYDILPVIDGIPFLLKQLFSNIILNSLKYASPDRKPVIKITSEPLTANSFSRNRLSHAIRFSDNGIGFLQQYSESIFNIFTRLHGIGEYKGSGVGLALCKKIMQTHNGGIEASGYPDKGASFTLYFPVSQKE